MITRFKRLIPTPEQLASSRWLRWMGPSLLHPRLWHVSRRGIALGVAIGVFFGLLIPLAQIPFAAAVAVAMRANLPAAVASTLVTNPVTMPPVYFAAYKLGSAVLGRAPDEDPGATPEAMPRIAEQALGDALNTPANEPETLWQRLRGVGGALLLGMAMMAVSCGLLTYVLINLGWHLRVRLKRRRRLRERADHPSNAHRGVTRP
jgi:uncharacterized protein (DUF2062 family)